MNNCQVNGQNLFALVTYTPEPLRNWLSGLRQLLPLPATCQPHITILPPRPLVMTVDDARKKITSILTPWRSFEIELSGVSVFLGSNTLYLDVRGGSSKLRRLHKELNTGELAHDEIFEFHPHVTIGGPVLHENLEAISRSVREEWQKSSVASRFQIEEVAFVSIAANGNSGDWHRLWEHKLDIAQVSGRAAHAAVSQTF